jgi:hypothetical protein
MIGQITKHRTENTMKNNTEAKKEPKAKAPKAKREPTAKVKAKAGVETEPADRLPGTVEELKATKGGLVCFLFLSRKGRNEIAAELKAAFKLTDIQAVKTVRRITGRARFFRRAFELMAAK